MDFSDFLAVNILCNESDFSVFQAGYYALHISPKHNCDLRFLALKFAKVRPPTGAQPASARRGIGLRMIRLVRSRKAE
jgi:hypothetical protein